MTNTMPFGTTSRPTLAELDAVPPGIVGEIIEGVLYTMIKPRKIAPDVAGWRRERMPEMPVDEPIRVVPDWVCEILSPTTR